MEKADYDPFVGKRPQRQGPVALRGRRARPRAIPAYGEIVCRCERVSEAEIVEADHGAGHTTLDGIKYFTRAQMGRCQGGFCTYKIIKIIMRETGMSLGRDHQARRRQPRAQG